MKVYFNNSCKICKAEIDLYKKEEIEEIDWVDITDNELAEQETSKDSKQLLRRLHVKDGEKVIGGAEAFLLLWKIIYHLEYGLDNKNLLNKDIEDTNITKTIEYINKIILFFFLLNLTKSLSSKSEISLSPTTG